MKQYLQRWPELKEFIDDIDERVSRAFRPPSEVILDDFDLQKLLKISKRKSAQIRADREITYYKDNGKIYYMLSDVIAYVTRNKVPAFWENLKFK